MLPLPAELLQVVCVPAERTVNHVLQYDPAAQQQLRPLQGKLLALQIGTQSVFVRILDNGIGLSFSNDALPDATLSGSLSDFLALAAARDKASTLINSAIDMSGDSEFAIGLTRIAQQLDIDWEALLTPLTGGLLAHELGKGLRGLLRWGQTTAPVVRTAAKEYLEDEAQLVTPAPLLAQFADEVDQLKLATDRLAARLDRLQQASAQPKE